MAPPAGSASFRETILAQFGADALEGSAISYEGYFRELFAVLKPRRVLEIGTRFGLSSALFASLVDFVVTIDIDKCPPAYKAMARRVWDFCGASDRVLSYYAKGHRLREANRNKRAFIMRQEFDFCFVDGSHDHGAIPFDFACVKHCGCVLFHDYKPATPAYADCTNHRMQEVAGFVDTLWPKPYLIGPKCSQMALWLHATHPARKDPAAAPYLAALPRTTSPFLAANLRQIAQNSLFGVRAAVHYAGSRKAKWRNSLAKRLRPKP